MVAHSAPNMITSRLSVYEPVPSKKYWQDLKRNVAAQSPEDASHPFWPRSRASNDVHHAPSQPDPDHDDAHLMVAIVGCVGARGRYLVQNLDTMPTT